MEKVREEIEKIIFGYLDLSERAQDPGELIDKIATLITDTEPVAKSPAAMAGSAANAATLKVKISGILMDAIVGHKEKYRTPEGFIRWGVVEGDINETIDAVLR